jgi:hypothetical protein
MEIVFGKLTLKSITLALLLCNVKGVYSYGTNECTENKFLLEIKSSKDIVYGGHDN